MNEVRIAPLVESHGEEQAVPVLIRRLVQAIDPLVFPVIARPFRHPSGTIRRAGGLEKALNAVAELHPRHSILALIDSDADCPRNLGPQLKSRAGLTRADLHIGVVLAHREYESWFLAALSPLLASAVYELPLPQWTTQSRYGMPKVGSANKSSDREDTVQPRTSSRRQPVRNRQRLRAPEDH